MRGMREHSGTIRHGKIVAHSDDQGPYKIIGIECDGKNIDCHIWDPMGIATNPKADSLAIIFTPDSDEGRAFALIIPAPADRVDQLKEGETQWKQFKRNQYVFLDDNGNVIISAGDKSGDTNHNTPKGKHTITAQNDVLVSSQGGVVHLNPI